MLNQACLQMKLEFLYIDWEGSLGSSGDCLRSFEDSCFEDSLNSENGVGGVNCFFPESRWDS